MRTNLKKKHSQAKLKENSKYLSVVGELRPTRQLKVYSSSPKQRFSTKLNYLIKACFNFALIGFCISAFSYFCSVSLETEVSYHLRKIENQMKNREDLKSYLSKVYSWQNLNVKAEKMNYVEAKKIEKASNQKSLGHLVFDIF